MIKGRQVFTSESVSMGHPDKVCDQLSDAVLDAMLEHDPTSRVACECLATTGLVVVAGEITSHALNKVQVTDLVRNTICDIGYTKEEYGLSGKTCGVVIALDKQSPDIAMGVDDTHEDHKGEIGAGDQGMMFGFACSDTPELMPLPVRLSHRLVEELARVRKANELTYLRPDAKSQVTVEYEGDTPVRIDTVVISTQHDEDVTLERIRSDVTEMVIKKICPTELVDDKLKIHVNPTGRFVIGGPHGDTGLTGRKIIVDTYGGMGRHGGGAFSGKDPTKVDRSAAYMARYVAKNVVASGLAKRCEVQFSYAIGVAEPTSVYVDTFGTAAEGVSDQRIAELVREFFKLTPSGIIESLNLRRPIYRKTAIHGHFGRELPEFTWEKTDKAADLKNAAGL